MWSTLKDLKYRSLATPLAELSGSLLKINADLADLGSFTYVPPAAIADFIVLNMTSQISTQSPIVIGGYHPKHHAELGGPAHICTPNLAPIHNFDTSAFSGLVNRAYLPAIRPLTDSCDYRNRGRVGQQRRISGLQTPSLSLR